MDKNHYQSPEGMVRERDFVSHDTRETNDVVHRSGFQTTDDNSQSQIQDGRSEIKVHKGKVHIFSTGSRKTSKKFLEKIEVGGFTWSKVSQPTKDFYFDEFKKFFKWEPHLECEVRAEWDKKAARCYGEFTRKLRKKNEKPTCLSDNAWKQFKNY
ncbi:OLC1v1030648C1 [Oldenlandia corymbosa var. corymbosa]|uniref:OLC1v1030648C1 n=1 Tax=Oldenlandia corymbosa var. corymbosa TaxID=529605 RepID=A0AAV1CJW6_OLDCO|nr:OLC1v1030648C1 [Oldenlandia corymbosa var. corymbosa]